MRPLALSLCALAMLVPVPTALAQESAKDIYPRTLKATAWVLVPEEKGASAGTGWLIDKKRRLLVTNEHVVGNKDRVLVFFPEYRKDKPIAEKDHYRENGRFVRGTVLDVDVGLDLAVVQLQEVPDHATEMKLAAESPGPGERVHSIGNPGASDALWVYTSGTVRQVYKKKWSYDGGDRREARVVETQQPINPGDSGGPMVNDKGELIAVNAGGKTSANLVTWGIEAGEVREYVEMVTRLTEPKTARDYNWRGNRFFARGKYRESLDDYTKAIELDPKFAMAYANRAGAFCARRDYTTAIEDCDKAIEIDPKLAHAYFKRGVAWSHKNDFDKAVRDYTKAIAINPKEASYYFNRARANFGRNPADAVADYSRAIEYNPDHATAYFERGQVLESRELYEKSLTDYAKAVQLDPNFKNQLERHGRRKLRVINETGEPIRVYLQYEALTTDKKWVWYCTNDPIWYDFTAGESALLKHDNWQVSARRVRIWAESKKTDSAWMRDKTKDVWLAPEDGYVSNKMQTFTYRFSKGN